MSVFLTMSFVILNQLTAETSDEFAQLSDFQPGFPAEFFAIIDGEDDLTFDPMGTQLGDDP